MLVQLEDSPHIRLVVLLVFRIHRVQFACSTRRGKERAVEECCETGEGPFKGRGPNIEVIIGIGCAGICVRRSVVLRKKLQREVLRRHASEVCKQYEPRSTRSPQGTSPFPMATLATSDFIHKKYTMNSRCSQKWANPGMSGWCPVNTSCRVSRPRQNSPGHTGGRLRHPSSQQLCQL